MRKMVQGALAALMLLTGPASADDDGKLLQRLALANAYDAACPTMGFSDNGREQVRRLLAKSHDNPSIEDDFGRKSAEYLIVMKTATIEGICDAAERKFGEIGTDMPDVLIHNMNGHTLEEIVAGLDRDAPDFPSRSTVRVFVMIAMAQARCRDLEVSPSAIEYFDLMNLRPKELETGGSLGPMKHFERMRFFDWMRKNDKGSTDKTEEWFCRQAASRFGPDGWIQKNLLIER